MRVWVGGCECMCVWGGWVGVSFVIVCMLFDQSSVLGLSDNNDW